jgi:PAS domain S-box-containing protein
MATIKNNISGRTGTNSRQENSREFFREHLVTSETDVERLKKVNEELLQARRAALNLMEDTMLSKEALSESEAHLAATLEVLPVGIAVINNKGLVVLSNKEMKRFLPTGIIPSRDKDRAWRWKEHGTKGDTVKPDHFPIERALTGETIVPGVEMLYIHDNGTELWIRVSSMPVKDKDGNIIEVVSVVTDISDLKKSTEDLKGSEQKLKELNENLERRVEARTQELIQLKLKQEKEKLNAMIFAQEKERTRIGEGLHNGVAQLLYAVQNKLQLLAPVNEKEREILASANNIIVDAITDTRRISFELMPPVLKDYGLKVALETLVKKIFKESIAVKLKIILAKRLSENLEISIYRLVQEIFSNIIKHAQASEVLLDVYESEGHVIIKASDNGIGFSIGNAEKLRTGVGLQAIHNRVKLLEGQVKYSSRPKKGTLVELKIPLGGG